MKLFGFNLGHREKKIETKTLSPEAWLREEIDDTPKGAVLANAYEQVVWVYRAVNVLAEAVANVPFVFSAGPRGRENLITSGPLHDFYERPHPHLNRFQYWELRVLWLMLRGECFRVPIYEDNPRQYGLAASHLSAGGDTRHATRGTEHAAHHQSSLKSVLLLDPTHFQHLVEDHELV